jgi:hypothetical protein
VKRNIKRMATITVFILLGLATAASPQGGGGMDQGARPGVCSNARVAGDWGYTKTGTLFLPTGAAVPFATTGKLVLEEDGTLSGVNAGSVNGMVSNDLLKGTFQINADCTGAATVEVYDQSGALLRTIGMALVVDDDIRELRGLVTSLVLPNGASLRSVITAQAKRMFRGENWPSRDEPRGLRRE